MKKAVAFQFYPDKWLAGTLHLTPEAYRAYHRILCWIWLHSKTQYSMPDNDTAWKMATLITDDIILKGVRTEIMNPDFPLFTTNKSKTKVVSRGLKKEVEKIKEWKRKSSIGGRASAKAREGKELHSKHGSTTLAKCSLPKSNTPTPSPTPIPITTTIKKKNKNVFIKPTPEEVTEYAKSINYKLSGQQFCDSNDAKGWVVGKNQTPMRDWKAAIRTWQRNEANNPTSSKTEASRKPVTIWELKQRLEAIDELILSLKAVMTSSYAADNKKAHPKEFAQLQDLKTQRLDILKQIGECGK